MLKRVMLMVVGLTLAGSPLLAAKRCVDKDKNEITVSGKGKARAAQCKAAGGTLVKVRKAKKAQ